MTKKPIYQELARHGEELEESLAQQKERRNHAEKEIQDVARRLEKIAEMGEDGILVYDEDFRIEFANNMASTITGYSHEELARMNFIKLLNKRDKKFLDEMYSQVETDESRRICMEMSIICADGAVKPVEICISIAHEDGERKTYVYLGDITERKKFEHKLKESEQRYRNLFEKLPVGAFVSTPEGKFLNCNQALLDMLGYKSKEEFLQLDIARDVYRNPTDRDTFRKIIEKKGYVKDLEVDFRRKDGEVISILLTGFIRRGKGEGIVVYEGLIIDINQHKKMERELRDANEFLTSLIESSIDGIIATDMKGNIVIFNSGAEQLLGYKSEEVIGKMNIREIYPPGMAKVVMEKMRGTEYGGVGKLNAYRIVHRNKWGELIEGSLSAAIIYNERGEEVATVGIFTDLREQLLMARELQETQHRLSEAEKLAALGRLTSQIAHELNNPIYGIMNSLELLKGEVDLQSPKRRFLDMSLEETTRIADLLRKMLSFSKPDEEKKELTNVNKILEELTIFLARQLRDHNIKVEMTLDQALPELMASPNQLRQVFLNIILNARTAMPYGGKLQLETGRKRENIVVKIKDTGVGIPKEIQGKIFEAFFTTQGKKRGVGLGLSACYGIVKEHQGEITVESEVGKGSIFSVILPV
jgi:two-component system NtrC family sensor kinase